MAISGAAPRVIGLPPRFGRAKDLFGFVGTIGCICAA
jgi:hypothetical protein